MLQAELRGVHLHSMILARCLLSLVICSLALCLAAQGDTPPIFQPAPRPMPVSAQTASGLRLEAFFSSLAPGGVGLLRLAGAGIEAAQALFRAEAVAFFPADDDAWYALIKADMNSQPRAYPLTVIARRATGAVRFESQLRIEATHFITQDLVLPGSRLHLADPAIENEELARLQALAKAVKPAPLWDASGFELPQASELTSPFGAYRILNGVRESRHTGWDQNLPTGSPVRAMAAGEVRFSGLLDIRGNYVLIDHGLGIYTGYAHFSELHARAGQRVDGGQIIGLSGNSGRSSAPHLHWEALLRGDWIDGVTLLELWLPAPKLSKAEAKGR